MSRKFKSSNEEQDDAFFGPSSSLTSSSANNDEELARNLQVEYDTVSPSSEPNRNRTNTLTLSSHMRNKSYQRRLQEQQDLEFALQLQRQGSTGVGNTNNDRDRKKTQEEEDERLAKAIQEAEGFDEPRGIIPQARRPQPQNTNNSRPSRLGGIRDNHTINALVPRCAACDKIVTFPIYALGNLYHKECFRCMGCQQIIQPNESFAVKTDEDGKRHPFHKNCYAEIYGLKCSVCQCVIEGDSNGRVSYVKHPFFEEVTCTRHSQHRRCNGCQRYEPLAPDKRFVDLGDAGRCACFSCIRSIIVDSSDAKPLWSRVIRFFERHLKLPVFTGMPQIPILIVPHETMNSQLENSYHQGATNIMTRGLCLSEHQIGWNVLLPSLSFDRNRGSFESSGHTYFQIPNSSKANPQSKVTAILCLSGLPADLTASILAHEATHAWFKLHPNFNPSRPIPSQVEEGCCQLVAMLFLNDGLDEPSSNYDGEGPTDEKLRQFFKFSIETDSSEVYGEGYRKAAKLYAQIGIEALLSHVVTYCEFPNI